MGVSPRTFNNYFSSKEAAIVWPATRRGARMASALLGRPTEEPLGTALLAAITDLYTESREDGLPPNWLRDFRTLVVSEPSLRGEYLKTSYAAWVTIAIGAPSLFAYLRVARRGL